MICDGAKIAVFSSLTNARMYARTASTSNHYGRVVTAYSNRYRFLCFMGVENIQALLEGEKHG